MPCKSIQYIIMISSHIKGNENLFFLHLSLSSVSDFEIFLSIIYLFLVYFTFLFVCRKFVHDWNQLKEKEGIKRWVEDRKNDLKWGKYPNTNRLLSNDLAMPCIFADCVLYTYDSIGYDYIRLTTTLWRFVYCQFVVVIVDFFLYVLYRMLKLKSSVTEDSRFLIRKKTYSHHFWSCMCLCINWSKKDVVIVAEKNIKYMITHKCLRWFFFLWFPFCWQSKSKTFLISEMYNAQYQLKRENQHLDVFVNSLASYVWWNFQVKDIAQ